MKQAAPGGLVTKATYDAAGRVDKVFQTDGRLDTSWTHAGSVSDDTVLRQQRQLRQRDAVVVVLVPKVGKRDRSLLRQKGNQLPIVDAR